MILDGEAEDRVGQSALIKMGSHHPIYQISLPFLRQQVASLKTGYCGGFPSIREFRENFEDFFKSGKNRGFSAKIREQNFKSGNFFSKPFSNLLNL